MLEEFFDIESMDLQARGIARRGGKVVFIDGALPGERVSATVIKRKTSFDMARLDRRVTESPQRVQPACPYFSRCGGCVMQHLEPGAQVAIKQRVLEDSLWHIGQVRAAQILPALHGPSWGYRHRARLSVRAVRKKGEVLVGFRERRGHYVVDMTQCLVLPEHVSNLLMPLRTLLATMSRPDRLPQIEVSVGDRNTALLLRHLEPLTASDMNLLRTFGREHNVSWWLQPKGPDTIRSLLAQDAEKLAYVLPEFGLRMQYRPNDFTQVNDAMNRSMVARVLSLLDIESTDRIADLFCGLGNFTLPLATRAREVVGIEGSQLLTDRAQALSERHGLHHRTRFATLNLFDVDAQWLRAMGYFDRMLIDPPREGAQAMAQALADLSATERPRKIVYVSCNPGSLARDAGILVRQGGYRLTSAGVVNMFPHTGHVESMAVFD